MEDKKLGLVAVFDVNTKRLGVSQCGSSYDDIGFDPRVSKKHSEEEDNRDKASDKNDDRATGDSPANNLRSSSSSSDSSNFLNNIKDGSSIEEDDRIKDVTENNYNDAMGIDDEYDEYDDDKSTKNSDEENDEDEMDELYRSMIKLDFDLEVFYWFIFYHLLKTPVGRTILSNTSINVRLFHRKNVKVYSVPVDAQITNETELNRAISTSINVWSTIKGGKTETTMCFSFGIAASKETVDFDFVLWMGRKLIKTTNKEDNNEFEPEDFDADDYYSFSQGVHSTSKGYKHKNLEEVGTAIKAKKLAENSRTDLSLARLYISAIMNNESQWNDYFQAFSNDMVERLYEHLTIMGVGKVALSQAKIRGIDFSSSKQPDIPEHFFPIFDGPGWNMKFKDGSDIIPKVSDIFVCVSICTLYVIKFSFTCHVLVLMDLKMNT